MHRCVLCFHCTIRHVSPYRIHCWAHSLAEVTLLSSMNTLTLMATDDGTNLLLGILKASSTPSGQPTTSAFGEMQVIVVAVVVVAVDVVVLVAVVVVVVVSVVLVVMVVVLCG